MLYLKYNCFTCTTKFLLFINFLHIYNIHLFTRDIYIHPHSLHMIHTQSVFTCNTGFSSLYQCIFQQQRGYLWSLHISPMEPVNHSCGYSGGSVRPFTF